MYYIVYQHHRPVYFHRLRNGTVRHVARATYLAHAREHHHHSSKHKSGKVLRPRHWMVGRKDPLTGDIKYVYYTRDANGNEYKLTHDNFLHDSSAYERRVAAEIADAAGSHGSMFKVKSTADDQLLDPRNDGPAVRNLGHLVLGQHVVPTIQVGEELHISTLPSLTPASAPFYYAPSKASLVLRANPVPGLLGTGTSVVYAPPTSPMYVFLKSRTVPLTTDKVSKCVDLDEVKRQNRDKVWSGRDDTYKAALRGKADFALTIVDLGTDIELARDRYAELAHAVEKASKITPRVMPECAWSWLCGPEKSASGKSFGYFMFKCEKLAPAEMSAVTNENVQKLLARMNAGGVYVYGEPLGAQHFLSVENPSGGPEILFWQPTLLHTLDAPKTNKVTLLGERPRDTTEAVEKQKAAAAVYYP